MRSLTKHCKNKCVRTAVTRSTATGRKCKTTHARPNRHDAGGTGRALAFALRAYVSSLHYLGVRTRPDHGFKMTRINHQKGLRTPVDAHVKHFNFNSLVIGAKKRERKGDEVSPLGKRGGASPTTLRTVSATSARRWLFPSALVECVEKSKSALRAKDR